MYGDPSRDTENDTGVPPSREICHVCWRRRPAPVRPEHHVWSTGSITSAVCAARSVVGFSAKIEVEMGSEVEAEEAANAGRDTFMLENFGANGVKIAAVRLGATWASEGKARKWVAG